MARIELATQISTTPNEIFVFFVPQRMPLWYGAEMNAHFEVQAGAADFAVGQKVRITGKWDHHLEWQFQDSYGVRGVQRWDLQLQANETKLIMRDEYVMPTTPGKILDRLITSRAVRLRDQSWLDRLKRFAERPDK